MADEPDTIRSTKLTLADVKRQSKLLPTRTKLDEFVYKRPNLNDTTDFETPQKNALAPKKPTKTKRAYNKTKKRDKQQSKIKTSLLRQDQLFSELVAQHSLAEQFNPDEIQLALVLSKSEVLKQDEDTELPDIRQQLQKFGFRTAPKEYYNEQILEVFQPTEGKSKKKRYRWSSKISALTLRNAEVQAEKLKRHITKINQEYSKSVSEFFKPRPTEFYTFISANLCQLNMPDFSNVIQDETNELNLEHFFVKNLFPVSHVPAGHLLRKLSKIQGRDSCFDEGFHCKKKQNQLEAKTSSAPPCLYPTDSDSLTSYFQPIRSHSPDIFDCSLQSDHEENIVDLTYIEDNEKETIHENEKAKKSESPFKIIKKHTQMFASNLEIENDILPTKYANILLDESKYEHKKFTSSSNEEIVASDIEILKSQEEKDMEILKKNHVILLSDSEDEHWNNHLPNYYKIKSKTVISENDRSTILLDESEGEFKNTIKAEDEECLTSNIKTMKVTDEKTVISLSDESQTESLANPEDTEMVLSNLEILKTQQHCAKLAHQENTLQESSTNISNENKSINFSDNDSLSSPVNKRARKFYNMSRELEYDLPLVRKTEKKPSISVEIPIEILDMDGEEIINKSQQNFKTSNQSAGTIDLTQIMDECDNNDANASRMDLIVLSDDEVNYSIIKMKQQFNNDINTSIINCLSDQLTVEQEELENENNVHIHDAIYDDSLTQALAIAAALEPCYPPASPAKEYLKEPVLRKENSREIQVNGVTYLVSEYKSPEPIYESKSDAELDVKLKEFGIKPLKRSQAIKVLNYIYRMMHPFVLNTNEEPIKQKELKIDLKDCFGQILLPQEQMQYANMLEAEEYIFQTNITKKTTFPLVPFHLAFSNLVAANPQLHERILMYEPIDVKNIYHFFKNMGIRYDQKVIHVYFLNRIMMKFSFCSKLENSLIEGALLFDIKRQLDRNRSLVWYKINEENCK